MGLAGVKETTFFRIPEFFDHLVRQRNSLLKPMQVTCYLKQDHQSINEACVVLEVSIEFCRAVLVGPEQQAVTFHVFQNKLSVANGGFKEVIATEDDGGFGKAHQH